MRKILIAFLAPLVIAGLAYIVIATLLVLQPFQGLL